MLLDGMGAVLAKVSLELPGGMSASIGISPDATQVLVRRNGEDGYNPMAIFLPANAKSDDSHMWHINFETGVVHAIGGFPNGAPVCPPVFDPSCRFAYCSAPFECLLYEVDLDAGNLRILPFEGEPPDPLWVQDHI